MLSESVVLLPETVAAMAKCTLVKMACHWGDDCDAVLDSWNALKEHLKIHCQECGQEDVFRCCLPNCSAPLHDSLLAVIQHMELSHMTREDIICPIRGCLHRFPREMQVMEHFSSMHSSLVNRTFPAATIRILLKPQHGLHPPIRSAPQHFPRVPFLFHVEVHPSRYRTTVPLASPRKKWRRLDMPDDITKSDTPPPVFNNLQNTSSAPPYNVPLHLDLEPILEPPQLELIARPPYWQHQGELEADERVGYIVFSRRVKELGAAGVLNGLGFWPEDVQMDDEDGDGTSSVAEDLADLQLSASED